MYFDEASERRQSDHEARIEAVRVGTIFAHDRKAHTKWQNAKRSKSRKRGLVGDALEAAVMGIAQMFPQNVIRGTV